MIQESEPDAPGPEVSKLRAALVEFMVDAARDDRRQPKLVEQIENALLKVTENQCALAQQIDGGFKTTANVVREELNAVRAGSQEREQLQRTLSEWGNWVIDSVRARVSEQFAELESRISEQRHRADAERDSRNDPLFDDISRRLDVLTGLLRSNEGIGALPGMAITGAPQASCGAPRPRTVKDLVLELHRRVEELPDSPERAALCRSLEAVMKPGKKRGGSGKKAELQAQGKAASGHRDAESSHRLGGLRQFVPSRRAVAGTVIVALVVSSAFLSWVLFQGRQAPAADQPPAPSISSSDSSTPAGKASSPVWSDSTAAKRGQVGSWDKLWSLAQDALVPAQLCGNTQPVALEECLCPQGHNGCAALENLTDWRGAAVLQAIAEVFTAKENGRSLIDGKWGVESATAVLSMAKACWPDDSSAVSAARDLLDRTQVRKGLSAGKSPGTKSAGTSKSLDELGKAVDEGIQEVILRIKDQYPSCSKPGPGTVSR